MSKSKTQIHERLGLEAGRDKKYVKDPYQVLQAGSCTPLIPVGFYQPAFELPQC